MTDPQVQTFLAALWRGASVGYYWSSGGKKSQWTTTATIAPCALGNNNVYMGIHGCGEARSAYERSRISDIAAINCLFAEFDAKDERYGSTDAIREHIKTLEIQPQVIVKSGGGYHCYWFIVDPILVDNSVRDYLRGIQAAWVKLVGGDPGAKDLARVLRLPGTLNAKYTPARKVEFARFTLTPEGAELIDINRLCELAEPLYEDQGMLTTADLPDIGDNRVVGNGEIPAVVNTLATASEGDRNSTLLWCACRLIEKGMSEGAITAELLPVAKRIGLTEHESLATIKSAHKQPVRNQTPQRQFGNALPDLGNRRMKMQEALRGGSEGNIS